MSVAYGRRYAMWNTDLSRDGARTSGYPWNQKQGALFRFKMWMAGLPTQERPRDYEA